jgi:6-pyruvoyltetrahydropterin/6-carboxytetrahydropterin synthase
MKGLENPTSENVARWIWGKIQTKMPKGARLKSVTVSETCTTGATYRGEA